MSSQTNHTTIYLLVLCEIRLGETESHRKYEDVTLDSVHEFVTIQEYL